MPDIILSEHDSIRYEYAAPTTPAGVTFVGFNALSADFGLWENALGKALRDAGHGTLWWNFRGQEGSAVAPDVILDDTLIVTDALGVLTVAAPVRPVFVGMSIGGLFAARAMLAGASCAGLVFLNTLRRPGARLAWINDAVARCAEVGGMELMRDLFSPLLFDEKWLAANRHAALSDAPYTPIDRASGAYRLLNDARASDWDLPYEALDVPALVVTGMQDHVFLDLGDVAALAARMPDARRIDIPDAGHMLPVECPETIARALLDFGGALAAGRG